MFSAREFEAALARKGFRHDRSTTDKLFFLWVEGKKTKVWTKVSMGRGEDIGDGLVTQIKRQMRLSKGQLTNFVQCALEYDDYIDLLRQADVIEQPD